MAKSEQFMEDRSMKPKAAPNSQGQQQGLKIFVEERFGSCTGVSLSYVPRQGVYINGGLNVLDFQAWVDAIAECANNREFVPVSIGETRKGAEYCRLTVKRDADGRVATEFSGQGNTVEVTWMPLKTTIMLKDNQPMAVSEQSERNARAWVKQQHRLIDRLEEMYIPFNPNNPQTGHKPQQQRAPYNPQQQAPQQQYQAPQQPSANVDDFFG